MQLFVGVCHLYEKTFATLAISSKSSLFLLVFLSTRDFKTVDRLTKFSEIWQIEKKCDPRLKEFSKLSLKYLAEENVFTAFSHIFK